MKQPLEKLLGKEIQNNQEAMMMGDDGHATSTAHLAVPTPPHVLYPVLRALPGNARSEEPPPH